MMAYLDEVPAAIAAIADRVGPAVVGVGQRWGVGSGVIVGDSQVLTNAHNLRGREVAISFADGHTATGSPAGVDLDGDIAVVSVETAGASSLEWSSDGIPPIGSAVFALSNPGGRGLRVTLGFVSGSDRSFRGPRGRRITGSLEHTAPLLPGSSGGPIVDAEGRLLGLNTNRLGEGFYLAIPADAGLRDRVDALARGEAPARPRIGVGIAPAEVARRLRRAVGLPEADGLLVRFVEEGSPAERAGIAEGDVIVAADGRATASADDLYSALEALGRTGSLELKLLRGTEERTVTLTPSSEAA